MSFYFLINVCLRLFIWALRAHSKFLIQKGLNESNQSPIFDTSGCFKIWLLIMKFKLYRWKILMEIQREHVNSNIVWKKRFWNSLRHGNLSHCWIIYYFVKMEKEDITTSYSTTPLVGSPVNKFFAQKFTFVECNFPLNPVGLSVGLVGWSLAVIIN